VAEIGVSLSPSKSVFIGGATIGASVGGLCRSFAASANVRYWHLADNPTAPAFVRYWTEADKVGFWPGPFVWF
jgi:hypothetical protein